MSDLPDALLAHLEHPSLDPLWMILRSRLERNGHVIRGSARVDLDDDGADRVAGLLSKRVDAGTVRIQLADLDAALRRSPAGQGLVAVVAALTGSPLRDKPSERATRASTWAEVWDEFGGELHDRGLASQEWAAAWQLWLHRSGIITRLGPMQAAATLRSAALVLERVADAFQPETTAAPPGRSIGELASQAAGDAHGLDNGESLAAIVLRAAAIAFDLPFPTSSADRRHLWNRMGVETDLVSSSVLVWGLRPPGSDSWSHMMNLRAEQGLITYLTLRELRHIDVAFTAPDAVVHGCENPQVLQILADANVSGPLMCVAGNPSQAAMVLLERVRLRYHGDFDWPGIAIAGRIYDAGATPWLMDAADYLEAAADVSGIPLAGPRQPTPWDPALAEQMYSLNVAIHEEAVTAALLRTL